MFGLVAAISAICSRSPSDSDLVLRLRSVLTKPISFALMAGSTCGPLERPRVKGFGCNALTILSAETVPSAASASPAVIDSAALMVIALPNNF